MLVANNLMNDLTENEKYIMFYSYLIKSKIAHISSKIFNVRQKLHLQMLGNATLSILFVYSNNSLKYFQSFIRSLTYTTHAYSINFP